MHCVVRVFFQQERMVKKRQLDDELKKDSELNDAEIQLMRERDEEERELCKMKDSEKAIRERIASVDLMVGGRGGSIF